MFSSSKTLFRRPAAGGATDPSFAYVPLLLNTTSTNGQQNNTFLDSSTNNFTITRTGTPTQGSITPYWPNGQWSNYFNGSNTYLSTPDSAGFTLSNANWTIECWIYCPNNAINRAIAGQCSNPNVESASTFIFYLNSTNQLFVEVYSGSTAYTASTSINVPYNQWAHVVATRDGNTVRLYINGVQYGTVAVTGLTLNNSASNFSVARPGESTVWTFLGYISNFRLVNGTCLYPNGTTFTPSTSPLTTSLANTQLLTCYSNRFIDANTATTAKTITVNGAPTVQAFQPFSPTASYTTALYGGSGYFNGSTDYLTAASSNIVNFGNGDFTAEAWIYLDAVNTSIASIISNYNNGSNGGLGWYVNRSTSGGIQVYSGNSLVLNANSAITAKTWTHIAICRASGTTRFFVNGVVSTSVSDSSNYGVDNSATGFGGTPSGGGGTSPFPGLISNLRIVKGTAVYTGAFTPPTLAPLATTGPASAASYQSTTNVNTSFAASNTSLLLNMANAGIYDAAVQNVITTVGDAQVSTAITAKWPPTSIRFDGTGDYLSVSAGSPQSLTFGTGDFTIEFWVYFTSNTGFQTLYDGRAAAGIYPLLYLNNGVINYYVGSNTVITSVQPSTGVWTFMSLRRSSGTTQFFINGTQSGGSYSDSNNYLAPSTSGARVGANFSGSDFLSGYIQDFRVTKGVARAATPIPTAAFPTR